MLSQRVVRSRRGGSKVTDSFLSVVIPAADVWEVARQAPQAKDVPAVKQPARTNPKTNAKDEAPRSVPPKAAPPISTPYRASPAG
jgi:hypothetical protein